MSDPLNAVKWTLELEECNISQATLEQNSLKNRSWEILMTKLRQQLDRNSSWTKSLKLLKEP